jgi:hypothetical protein
VARRGALARVARDIEFGSRAPTSHPGYTPTQSLTRRYGDRDVRLLTSPLPYLTLVDQLTHVKHRFRLPYGISCPRQHARRGAHVIAAPPPGWTPAPDCHRTGPPSSPATLPLSARCGNAGWTRRAQHSSRGVGSRFVCYGTFARIWIHFRHVPVSCPTVALCRPPPGLGREAGKRRPELGWRLCPSMAGLGADNRDCLRGVNRSPGGHATASNQRRAFTSNDHTNRLLTATAGRPQARVPPRPRRRVA